VQVHAIYCGMCLGFDVQRFYIAHQPELSHIESRVFYLFSNCINIMLLVFFETFVENIFI
jgi:hypothetical protein